MKNIKHLTNIRQSVQRFLSAPLLFLAIAAYLVLFTGLGHAATASFYLSPASQTVTTGSTFNVVIRLNASEQPVDAVAVHVTYPTDKLELVGSVSYAGSGFEIAASESVSAGDINFSRGTTTPKNADVIVATLGFKALAGTAV